MTAGQGSDQQLSVGQEQREFATSILHVILFSGNCNYFNESVGIFQATYPWTMYF